MFNLVPWQLFLLALANRCRGGLIAISSGQLSRLMLWALPAAATVWLTAHPVDLWEDFCYTVELITAFWSGAALVAWGKYDTLPDNWSWGMLTLQGILYTSIPALISIAFVRPSVGAALFLSGLSIAPCYWLGWKIPSRVKGLEQGIPIGESLFGFIIGLSLYLSQLI